MWRISVAVSFEFARNDEQRPLLPLLLEGGVTRSERGACLAGGIHVRILTINGDVRSVKGRSGEMPRNRSLVKAFDLIPVVEQVLPDRQKTEVTRSFVFMNLTSGYTGRFHAIHNATYMCIIIGNVYQGHVIRSNYVALCVVNFLGVRGINASPFDLQVISSCTTLCPSILKLSPTPLSPPK